MIDFKDHQGLVNKLAFRFTQRLHKTGIHSYVFDDMVSEMAIAFIRAQKTFDENKGFQFSTYFWSIATNHYNQLARKLLSEQYGSQSAMSDESPKIDVTDARRHYGLRVISMSQLSSEEGGEVEFADSETFAQPGAALEAKQQIMQIARSRNLSAQTKLYLRTLIDLEGKSQLSPQKREWIKRHASVIRVEIEQQFGIKMDRITVSK